MIPLLLPPVNRAAPHSGVRGVGVWITRDCADLGSLGVLKPQHAALLRGQQQADAVVVCLQGWQVVRGWRGPANNRGELFRTSEELAGNLFPTGIASPVVIAEAYFCMCLSCAD